MSEQNADYLFWFCVIIIMTPLFAYGAAKRKGRRALLWAFFVLLFNPLIILLELLPNLNVNQSSLTLCQTCQKQISIASSSCPNCGHPNRYKNNYQLTFLDYLSIIGEICICLAQILLFIIIFMFLIEYFTAHRL